MKGMSFTPFLTYRNPTPLGPPNLCPLALSRSTPSSFTSSGMCPKACTASVWNRIPLPASILPISAMGWMDPISLFAVITDTRTVSGRIAFSSSSSLTIPSSSTPTLVTSKPLLSRYLAVSSIAWCSIVDTMMCLPLFSLISAPETRAQLSDSVPPEVKNISEGSAFRQAAICALAFLTAALGLLDMAWMLEGFAYSSMKYGIIASSASFFMREVAALSK